MSRAHSIRCLVVAAAAVGAIASACRLLQQGEVPPLAPRPVPTSPTSNPVPGAPSPIDPAAPRTPPIDAPPPPTTIPARR